jgi:hypothetical protein
MKINMKTIGLIFLTIMQLVIIVLGIWTLYIPHGLLQKAVIEVVLLFMFRYVTAVRYELEHDRL